MTENVRETIFTLVCCTMAAIFVCSVALVMKSIISCFH